jgi:hypothetical protein
MYLRNILSIAAVTALGLGLSPGSTLAQQKSLKDQIVGTWTLVSWVQTKGDGSKFNRFGTNPKGINTFDATGHFTLIIQRPDLPKISSGDPMKVTAEEGQAIAEGAIAYFGTYTVDEASKTVSEKLEGTTLTNQLSVPQDRTVTSISADEMHYMNSTAVAGGKIELVWKRAQ